MAGNAIVGALRVTLGLDSAAFENGMDAAQKKLKSAGSAMQGVGARMAGIGAGMSAAITAPFIALGAHLLQGSQDAAHAAGQVNAALESMGGASGKTADELSKTAESLRNLTGIDDDEILTKVTSNLLTFGNVAGTVFDRAQVAALDLATRMGGDLQAATLTIGKALNDPVKGLTALGRAGIQFTAQQKEQIKQMVAVGDAAGAQSIMLAELEKQFGGAAKAAGDADAWKPLKTALMDLEGAFEPIVRDVIAPLIAKAGEIVRAFASVSPEVLKFVAVGAAVAAAIGPVLIAFGGLVAAAGAIATAFAGGGVLAGLLPFLGPIGLAAAAVAAAFMIWGDDIVPMLQTFARQLADSIGPKIKPLFEALMGAVKAVGEIFSAIFSMGGTGSASSNLQVFGEIVARVLGAAVEIITGAVNVITNVLRALAALLRGDFSTMWNALGSAVSALVTGVLRAFEALFPGVIGFVRQLVEGVTAWLQGRLGAVLGWVIGKVKEVGDAFFKLYDAVVGHSYIPDMVEEIGDWISKLQGNMVSPVQNMTDASASAFSGMAGDIDSTMSGLFRSIQSKDWKGVLGGLFDIGGKMGGGIGKVAGIGKSILSAFGGGLPGFKTGGSFTVGGAGGLDSSIVAFRGTPGERVDISTKGQQRQNGGGGASIVHVSPSPYFDVQVQKVAGPMVSDGMRSAVQASSALVPSQMARADTYTVGRRRR